MSWQTPENLSADEIYAALDGSGQFVVAGGTANARTATPATTFVLVNGNTIDIGIPAGGSNTAAVTLDVSGTGALSVYKISQNGGGSQALTGGELLQSTSYRFEYSSALNGYLIKSPFVLKATDIPSTLNATTFSNGIVVSGAATITGNTANSVLNLNSSTGASLGYSTGISVVSDSNGIHMGTRLDIRNTGINTHRLTSATGARHEFFDKNGVEQLRVDENGSWFGGEIFPLQVGLAIYGGANGTEGQIRFGNTISVATAGAHVNAGIGRGYFHSGLQFGDASYIQAPLSTRAASTAFGVCPVATGDIAEVDLRENQYAGSSPSTWGALIWVDTAGAVTLNSPVYGTVTSTFVNSSSPGAAEIGIYTSAGVLYCKPGSGYTGKIATFSKIAKA